MKEQSKMDIRFQLLSGFLKVFMQSVAFIMTSQGQWQLFFIFIFG